MKYKKQVKAFDGELHGLCLRYLNEFDLTVEDMLEVIMREEVFLIAMGFVLCERDGDYADKD